jgi:hypothetical protein
MKTRTAVTYRVFTRIWWRNNPGWPNGLEPHAGRQTTIARHCTEDEARDTCRVWNANHNPGRLSRKAEYDQE